MQVYDPLGADYTIIQSVQQSMAAARDFGVLDRQRILRRIHRDLRLQWPVTCSYVVSFNNVARRLAQRRTKAIDLRNHVHGRSDGLEDFMRQTWESACDETSRTSSCRHWALAAVGLAKSLRTP